MSPRVRSHLIKNRNLNSNKFPIDMDVVASIDVEMDNIMMYSGGGHKKRGSSSAPGAGSFIFGIRALTSWCSFTIISMPSMMLRKRD